MTAHPFELKSYLKDRQSRVDAALERYLKAAHTWPARLHESMRYSVFAGGKRLRPILCLAACEALGQDSESALAVACALEMIHTYSLIHDDLPAMDDDDLRRGNPTNHKVFGEAIAILAGDALLTDAFTLVARGAGLPASVTLEILAQLGEAAGSLGMVGGQAEDLLSEGKKISAEALSRLHAHKTGKLIAASVTLGALVGQAGAQQLEALKDYGEKIGLAFQIADDVLDIEGGAEIGKDIGSDLEKDKATYPSILGLEASKRLSAELTEGALLALKDFGHAADPLREIARYVVYRKN